MQKTGPWIRFILAGCAAALPAAPAAAKVVFTGYADVRFTPERIGKISGSDAVLSTLGVTRRRTESRTFAMDSVGIFATTTFDEKTDFLIDITYRRVGATVGETRLQYAYVDYRPTSDCEVKAGRVTLPIGYYNENYFYPFQRWAITPPLFQSAIIGLPIADHGVVASKTVEVGPANLYGALFLVNGYGPSRTSTDTFREGLRVTGALQIANNLRDTNPNNHFAYGGNFRASFLKDQSLKVGVSGYQGAWSLDGRSDFTMLNAYAALDAGPFKVLAEGLRTDTDRDNGVVPYFSVSDWKSTGGFIEANARIKKWDTGRLDLFLGGEATTAQGKGSAAMGRERLTQHKCGLAWTASPSVTFKTQADWLKYQLPLGSEAVKLVSKGIMFNVTLTY